MKATFNALLTTTVLSISATFAADSVDGLTEQSSAEVGLHKGYSTIIDTGVGRSFIIFGKADLEDGNTKAAIEKYQKAVLNGTAMQAAEAALNLSNIEEFSEQDAIAALEHVVSMGQAQWAYDAACRLVDLDVNKGIAALQKVANFGSPLYARISGEVLFKINQDTANVAAIDVLRKVIRMNTYNPSQYADDFSYNAYVAGSLLSKKSALSDEDIEVLKGIVVKLSEILGNENLDIVKTPDIYHASQASKHLIELLLAEHAK